MADAFEDIRKLAPQTLLASFTQKRLLLCFGVALGAHIVLVGLTSVAFIFGFKRSTDATPADTNAVPAVAAADSAEPRPENGSSAEPDRQELLEKHGDAPVVREITETASPDEIPDEPDDLGLSIKDTNHF